MSKSNREIEQIQEEIEVVVKFSKRNIRPLSFTWENQTYTIHKIYYRQFKQEVLERICYFLVQTKDIKTMYCISFNTEKFRWKLEGIQRKP